MVSPDPTAKARATARAVLYAPRTHRQTPHERLQRAPVQVVQLPLLALYAAEQLPRAARVLYHHLWIIGRLVTECPLPPWFYHTDAHLTRETGLSRDTLRLARHAIRAAGLAFYTDNQGQGKIDTHYLLRFPTPMPPGAAGDTQLTWAREVAALGEPPNALDAWCALVTRTAPKLADLLALMLAEPPGRTHRRAELAARIPEVSPWLYHQLTWAAPELFLRDVARGTWRPSEQPCLNFTPEIDSQSTSCSTPACASARPARSNGTTST